MTFKTVRLCWLVILLLGACAPTAPVAPASGQLPSSAPTTPKVVTIGILREPNSFHGDLTQGTGSQGGNTQVLHIPTTT